MEPVSKKIAEEKLVVLIQELGTEFAKFVQQNSIIEHDLIKKNNSNDVSDVNFYSIKFF